MRRTTRPQRLKIIVVSLVAWGSQALPRRIDAIRHVLEGAVVVFLLAWGIYATLTVSDSTSPSSSGGMLNAIMQGVHVSSWSYLGSQGGSPIPPDSVARFSMVFESSPTYNASRGWPQDYPVQGGLGIGWGPFLPSDPSSTLSPFIERYAIFTFFFSCSCSYSIVGPGGVPGLTYAFGTAEHTWIVQADSPGNYTLLLSNGYPGNATGMIVMSYSTLTLTPVRPYLFQGLATIGVAIAFSVPLLYTSWRNRRVKSSSPAPIRIGKDVPTD